MKGTQQSAKPDSYVARGLRVEGVRGSSGVGVKGTQVSSEQDTYVARGSAAAGLPEREEGFEIAAVGAAVGVDIGGGLASFPGDEEGFDVSAIDAAILVEVGSARG